MPKDFFSPDFTLSKRHLGVLGILGGVAGFILVLLYDQLGLSDPGGGFGPSQMLALGGAALAILIGLSLIPLGDDPA
jgi:hypothetical protein